MEENFKLSALAKDYGDNTAVKLLIAVTWQNSDIWFKAGPL